MSNAVFLSRVDFETGTIVEPSIVKLVVSERGSSRFSGRRSASSTYLLARILATNLGGIGERPGPKLKAFSGPRRGFREMLGAWIEVGIGNTPLMLAFDEGWDGGNESGTLPFTAATKEGAVNVPCWTAELPDGALDVVGNASPNRSNCAVEVETRPFAIADCSSATNSDD